MFIHQPFGTFDFTGAESKFTPLYPTTASFTPPAAQGQPPTPPAHVPLPIDLFFVTSREPAVIMAEYARLTGQPEMPPLWSFGYQQSHRTLAGREEILARSQDLPREETALRCHDLSRHRLLPLRLEHRQRRVQLQPEGLSRSQSDVRPAARTIISRSCCTSRIPRESVEMEGTVKDTCDPTQPRRDAAELLLGHASPRLRDWAWMAGGPMKATRSTRPSRLVRNRMYWEAPQLDRPNERPYALHRNGVRGHAALRVVPLVGRRQLAVGDAAEPRPDRSQHGAHAAFPIGAPTSAASFPPPNTTGELYVRWFQFAAFCPLFRSHGRIWTLRLPWGWNMGAAQRGDHG